MGSVGVLTVRPIQGSELGYEYKKTLTDTNEIVVIPPLKIPKQRVSVTVAAGVNSGLVKFTTSLDSEVKEEIASGAITDVIWQDWALGATTGTDSDVLLGDVAALKMIATGEVVFEVKY